MDGEKEVGEEGKRKICREWIRESEKMYNDHLKNNQNHKYITYI